MGEERECNRTATRQVRDRNEDENCQEDNGRAGKRRTGQDHRDQVSSDGEGGEYCKRGADHEGNDKSAEWSGADSKETKGSAIEEEAKTAGRAGGECRCVQKRRGKPKKGAWSSNKGKRWQEVATPGKPPPRPPTRREHEAAMGRGKRKRGDPETGGENRTVKYWECRATTGDARPPEWTTSPLELETRGGGIEASGVAENPRGPFREWAGDSSPHRAPTLPE